MMNLVMTLKLCENIVDLVEDWLPEAQSAAGSQNTLCRSTSRRL
jgi:hypothetical protein